MLSEAQQYRATPQPSCSIFFSRSWIIDLKHFAGAGLISCTLNRLTRERVGNVNTMPEYSVAGSAYDDLCASRQRVTLSPGDWTMMTADDLIGGRWS